MQIHTQIKARYLFVCYARDMLLNRNGTSGLYLHKDYTVIQLRVGVGTVLAVQWLRNEQEYQEIVFRFPGKRDVKNVQTGSLDDPAFYSVAAESKATGTLN